MTVQDYLTTSVLNKDLQDELYYHIWFEFLMNYDKHEIREAYQRAIENQKNKVTAQQLREAGYSEEDIQQAML